MSRVRRATAILVTRGAPPEVLLVERAPELRFFGGYHALPGGVIDPEDRADTDHDEAAALRACARRELFEETGLLVGAGSMPEAKAVRRALLGDDRGPWRDAGPADPGSDHLALLGEITTPPFAPVRYHTTFYRVSVDEAAEADLWPGELVGAKFWRPADALDAWRRDEILIVPPVLFILELLAGDESAFESRFRTETEALDDGRLHPVRFTPGILVAPLETPTMPPATTTNTVLAGEDRVWIVDPSSPERSEQERLFERIDAARTAGADLGGVLLTHHHPDHRGALAAVCERYSLAVHAHAECLARLPHTPSGSRALRDGDTLPLGHAPDGTEDWKLHVIETPGHSPDHLVFLDDRYRSAIVGDLLSALSTVVIDPAEGHLHTYLRSLRRLRDAGPTTLVPGHGPATRDGIALIERTLKHRSEREEKLRAALGKAPLGIDELLPRVYDDVDTALWSLARQSLEAGLIKLEEDGAARRANDGWALA